MIPSLLPDLEDSEDSEEESVVSLDAELMRGRPRKEKEGDPLTLMLTKLNKSTEKLILIRSIGELGILTKDADKVNW